MQEISAKTISKLDTVTIRFQNEIINRLKLYDFAKSAILHYSESQKMVLQGYSFESLQSRFRLIGFKKDRKVKSIGYKDMVDVGSSYVRGELSDSIFVLNMATFEHWLLSLLKELILSNPRKFYPKSNKLVEITHLRKFPEMSMLWENLVDDYLSSIPYQGMTAMLKVFLSCFGLNERNFTDDLLGKINENSQCRNVIMHNQKRANATYVKKSGVFAKYSDGEGIVISEDILYAEADNLLRFMQDFRNNHA